MGIDATVGLERLRFVIGELPEGQDAPRRRDVTVFEADGSIYEGPLISPSSFDGYSRCERIFGFDKLDKVPRVEKHYHIEGRRLHKEILEDWLLARIPPTSRSVIDSGVLKLFPPPRDGLRAEECFVLRAWSVEDGKSSAVVFWGFKDLEFEEQGEPNIGDLKTTSDLIWQKTRGDLKKDAQCIIYAADKLAEFPDVEELKMKWVYMTRSKPYKSADTPLEMSREHMEMQILRFLPVAQEMQKLYTQGTGLPPVETKKGDSYVSLNLKPNPQACSKYGGCAYASLCEDLKSTGTLRSLFAQDKEAKKRKTLRGQQREPKKERKMGTLSAIANQNKKPELAAKADAAEKAAPTKEVAPASTSKFAKPPSEEAEVSKAVAAATSGQKSGTLQSLLHMARGGEAPPAEEKVETPENTPEEIPSAAEATGINPPDAKPPEEVQKDEETVLAKAGDKQKNAKDAEEKKSEAGRGRPKGAKGKTPALSKAFILVVDCIPIKGIKHEYIDSLIEASRDEVEKDAEMDYRLIQYNDGPKALGAQILFDLDKEDVKGTYFVSSRSTEREVLESLMRRADVVIKGGF